MADWLALGAKHSDFVMGAWGARYPEEEIHEIAELMNVMNSEPRDDLEIADEQTKPAYLREDEAFLADMGIERRVLYVKHTQSGTLAG